MISRPVTLFWQRVNQFFSLNYPLYVERLTRELQLPMWNLRLDSAGNRTWASQTRSERTNHSVTELLSHLVKSRDRFEFLSSIDKNVNRTLTRKDGEVSVYSPKQTSFPIIKGIGRCINGLVLAMISCTCIYSSRDLIRWRRDGEGTVVFGRFLFFFKENQIFIATGTSLVGIF